MLRQPARANQSGTKGRTANDPTFLPWGSPGGRRGPGVAPGRWIWYNGYTTSIEL